MTITRVLAAFAADLVLCQPAAADLYFPRNQAQSFVVCKPNPHLPPSDRITAFEISWYSQHLEAAQEPSLYEQAYAPLLRDPADSYRFTWLRTFHAPVTVRVDQIGGKMVMTAKRLTGKGGYNPGRVAETLRRELTPAEGEKVRTLLNPAKTLRLDCEMGTDGSEWVVETRNGASYHYAAQYMPQSGPVRAFGLYMLGLTGWRIDSVY